MVTDLQFHIEELDAAIEYFENRRDYQGSSKHSAEWHIGFEYAAGQALPVLKMIKDLLDGYSCAG